MLNVLWAAFLTLAFVCGAVTGRLSEVSAALTEGAAGAVTLAIGIAGLMCFWSGIMELMQQSGLTHIIARFLMPVLRPLFGKASEDSEAMQAVSANVTANLLGLSNAATPLGLRAASRLHKLSGSDTASDAVLTLIVLNSASIQLVPSTVAAVPAGRRNRLTLCCRYGVPPSYRLRQRSCCAGQAVQFFRLRRLRIKNSAACGLRKEGYALQTIQAAVVPFLLAFTAMYAVYRGTAVFPVFIEGAKKGMQTAVGILPTMIGMLTAVYMLRASGAIDLASAWLAPLFHLLGIPQECVPLALLKPISGGGGLSLGSELIRTAGPDSYVGRVAAVMLGSSETSIYTIGLYAGHLGLKRTRYAIPAALCADLAAFMMSAALADKLFPIC